MCAGRNSYAGLRLGLRFSPLWHILGIGSDIGIIFPFECLRVHVRYDFMTVKAKRLSDSSRSRVCPGQFRPMEDSKPAARNPIHPKRRSSRVYRKDDDAVGIRTIIVVRSPAV